MERSSSASKRVLRPPQVRGANRAAVLHLLRLNDFMSRADIARQCGLSEGTVSRIMAGLIDDGLVKEDGEENSTGGRPGRRLALEPRRVAFGAEIQNWETRCAVSTMHGRIAETRRFRTPATAEETVNQIAEHFRDLRKQLGSNRIPGAGVCVRGIVDSESGTVLLGNRSDWVSIPVKKMLEAKLREPIFVENNVRAAALAEHTYGLPEIAGSHCLLFVKVDEGVGMGILLDGKVYHGPHKAAGEFGQMVIAFAPGQERHDRPGCLERLASNPFICDRYAELSGSRKLQTSGDTSARVRRIAQLASSGDASARQSLEEVARYLGVGISNVIWGLDADAVVIDGALTEAWPLIEPLLREQLPDNREPLGMPHLLLRPSSLGGEAALIGAASLPFANVFATGDPVFAAG